MEMLRRRKTCPYCNEETFGIYKRIVLYFTKAKPCSNCERLVEGSIPFFLNIRILGIAVTTLVVSFDLHPNVLFLPIFGIFLHWIILKPVYHDIYSAMPCISCKKYDTLYYKKEDKVCINCTDKYAKIFN